MSDLQRDKFEAWFKRHHDIDYCSPNVKSVLLECWQAAIESVVVDLSAIDGVTDDSGRTSFDVIYRGDVEKALGKAGIKYEQS